VRAGAEGLEGMAQSGGSRVLQNASAAVGAGRPLTWDALTEGVAGDAALGGVLGTAPLEPPGGGGYPSAHAPGPPAPRHGPVSREGGRAF